MPDVTCTSFNDAVPVDPATAATTELADASVTDADVVPRATTPLLALEDVTLAEVAKALIVNPSATTSRPAVVLAIVDSPDAIVRAVRPMLVAPPAPREASPAEEKSVRLLDDRVTVAVPTVAPATPLTLLDESATRRPTFAEAPVDVAVTVTALIAPACSVAAEALTPPGPEFAVTAKLAATPPLVLELMVTAPAVTLPAVMETLSPADMLAVKLDAPKPTERTSPPDTIAPALLTSPAASRLTSVSAVTEPAAPIWTPAPATLAVLGLAYAPPVRIAVF